MYLLLNNMICAYDFHFGILLNIRIIIIIIIIIIICSGRCLGTIARQQRRKEPISGLHLSRLFVLINYCLLYTSPSPRD